MCRFKIVISSFFGDSKMFFLCNLQIQNSFILVIFRLKAVLSLQMADLCCLHIQNSLSLPFSDSNYFLSLPFADFKCFIFTICRSEFTWESESGLSSNPLLSLLHHLAFCQRDLQKLGQFEEKKLAKARKMR